MALFHKDINERLAKHTEDLKNFGFLPENWFWHRDKIQELETVDKKLISDIIELHKSHQAVPGFFENIAPILQQLHQDLSIILRQRPSVEAQKQEAKVVNRLLAQIKQIIDQNIRKEQLKEWGFEVEKHPLLAKFLIMHLRGKIDQEARKQRLIQLKEWGLEVEKHPQLTEFLIMHWDGTKELVKMSGHQANRWWLFMYGLPAIENIINESTWPGLVEMAKVVGEETHTLFMYHLPAFKDIINERTLPGMVEMAKAAGKDLYLFNGLRAVKDIINERTWPMIVKGFLKIVEKVPNIHHFIYYILPEVAIHNPNFIDDTLFWETLDDYVRHPKLLRNSTNFLYWYELKKQGVANKNLSVIERIRLRKEESFKEFFIKNIFIKKYGFETNIKELPLIILSNMLACEKVTRDVASVAQKFVLNSKKQFPLNKEYYYQNVKGLKIEKLNSLAVKSIILSLVSITLTSEKRWSQRHNEALEQVNQLINNKNKLKDLINFSRSCIDQGNVFKDISAEFNTLRERGDQTKESLLAFIDFFLDSVRKNRTGVGKKEELFNQKIEPLMDILTRIKSELREEGGEIRGILIKTQKPCITDIMDYDTTHCCAFYPYGNKEGCLGYLEDDYIGLIQCFSVDSKKRINNIYGVIIFAMCEDQQKNTVLLIDSAEGDENFLKNMKGWQEIYHNVIVQLAKDINAKYIVYYKEANNTVPKEFLRHIGEKFTLSTTALVKKGDLSKKRYIESFGEGIPKGNVNGYVEQL